MQNNFEFNEFPCSLAIDYSEIAGKTILPFEISLNLEDSVIEPKSGENQRFSYIITGKGEVDPVYSDLDHITFGFGNISADEITNITVIVDGVEQEINFSKDGNVMLLKNGEFDPADDCEGLKFDFGLDKTNGIMHVSFELTNTYPLGQMEIYLFGRDSIAKGMTVCGPVNNFEKQNNEESIITVTGFHETTVSVPVTVTPFVNVGPTKTHLLGESLILSGISTCPGTQNGSCQFTISQNICVEIPIEIGGTASLGELRAVFGNATNEKIADIKDEKATDDNFNNDLIKASAKYKPFRKQN